MSDSKYFTTTKKGEIFELKSELNSDKKEKKREAVKKVWIYRSYSKLVTRYCPFCYGQLIVVYNNDMANAHQTAFKR